MIHQKMCAFLTDLMEEHPDKMTEIAEALCTALATTVKTASLNHSATMASQGADVLDHLSLILNESEAEAKHTEATERKH